jgi:cardiolipin synthase
MKRIWFRWKIPLVTLFAGLFFVVFFSSFLTPFADHDYKVVETFSVEDPRFAKAVGDLLLPSFVEGNKVHTLLNGDQIFPAMLESIRSAQKTITFESYIYWSGQVGETFAKALAERSRNGVKVHVLLDWAGSGKVSDEIIHTMTDAGVEVERFHSPKWYNITRLNYRTHRKVLIIDGKVGFTGGVGIADEWSGDGLDPKRWRDTHYKVEGPVVNQMQSAFMDNWRKTKPEVYTSEDYFPKVNPKGGAKAQMFISSAEEGGSSVRVMYLIAIASARKSIYLESAYFVPDPHVIDQLIEAKKRGVDIKIIVPGPVTDSEVVKSASQELWGELLKEDIEIFAYQPAMFHCKVFIVDNYFVSVGSTNFDERSFRINDEANLNVLDHEFARAQLSAFNLDLSRSKRITYEQWKNRSSTQKILGQITWVFRSQL